MYAIGLRRHLVFTDCREITFSFHVGSEHKVCITPQVLASLQPWGTASEGAALPRKQSLGEGLHLHVVQGFAFFLGRNRYANYHNEAAQSYSNQTCFCPLS